MKTGHVIGLSVLAGVALGAIAVQGLATLAALVARKRGRDTH
jgi:hypothetical protein